MSKPSKKFDCVLSMRKVRDKLSVEIEGMSYDELLKWLRTHEYTDSLLQRLAKKELRKASFVLFTPWREPGVDRRYDEGGQECRGHESADDDCRQRPLDFGSCRRRRRHGEKAEAGDQGCHEDRSQAH